MILRTLPSKKKFIEKKETTRERDRLSAIIKGGSMLQQHNILIVEDNDEYRDVLEAIITKDGLQVSTACNGHQALEKINQFNFDLILTDIQMPEMNGIELLKKIKTTTDVPIIILTGLSHLIETKTAFELGVDEFLLKPCGHTEINSAIRRCLQRENTKDLQRQPRDDKFCAIMIDELSRSDEIQLDVYIRLSQFKYIKIAQEGTKINRERLESYKNHGVNYLYISSEDFRKVVGFKLIKLESLSSDEKTPIKEKLNFLSYSGEVLLEKVFVAGLDKSSFYSSKNFLESSLSIILENKSGFDILKAMDSHGNKLYSHSLAVSFFSILIARKMNSFSLEDVFKIGMGGLLHDIGKKELPTNIIFEKKHQLTAKQQIILKSHVTRGMDILFSLRYIPKEVIKIVYEHHEQGDEEAYPRNILPSEMHPFSKIVGIANEFCSQCQGQDLGDETHSFKIFKSMSQGPWSKVDSTACQIFIGE